MGSAFLIWLAASAALVVGAGHAHDRQLASAEAVCACRCGYVEPVGGNHLTRQEDVAAVLTADERVVTRWPLFAGGPLICVAADDPAPAARLEEIRAAVEALEQQRRQETRP